MQSSIKAFKKTLIWGLTSLLFATWGCVIAHDRGYDYSREGGPPPWAPAHGHRAKHHYFYYPSAFVYFEKAGNLYFYFEDGKWHRKASLPAWLKIWEDEYVILDMDSDKPYKFHSDVKKWYPPEYHKKSHKRK